MDFEEVSGRDDKMQTVSITYSLNFLKCKRKLSQFWSVTTEVMFAGKVRFNSWDRLRDHSETCAVDCVNHYRHLRSAQ